MQPLDLFPRRNVSRARAELEAHLGERPGDVDPVERQARGRIVLRADPVATLEAVAHATRDLREARPVGVERVGDRRRRTSGGLVALHVLRQHISRIGTH